jgi:hypothetical protein
MPFSGTLPERSVRARPGRRRVLSWVLAVAIVLAVAAGAHAQFGRGFFGFGSRYATASDFDGTFHYCRVVYRAARDGVGGDWTTDYPRADINMSIRLSELTRTNVGRNSSGDPEHLLLRLTSDELYLCPLRPQGGRSSTMPKPSGCAITF